MVGHWESSAYTNYVSALSVTLGIQTFKETSWMNSKNHIAILPDNCTLIRRSYINILGRDLSP